MIAIAAARDTGIMAGLLSAASMLDEGTKEGAELAAKLRAQADCLLSASPPTTVKWTWTCAYCWLLIHENEPDALERTKSHIPSCPKWPGR